MTEDRPGNSERPPHMRRIHATRYESTEKIAGFPAYELVQDPDRTPKPRHTWRLNARAHGRTSTTWHRNPDAARQWAREDYSKGSPA